MYQVRRTVPIKGDEFNLLAGKINDLLVLGGFQRATTRDRLAGWALQE